MQYAIRECGVIGDVFRDALEKNLLEVAVCRTDDMKLLISAFPKVIGRTRLAEKAYALPYLDTPVG